MPIDVVKCFMVKDSSIPFRKSNLVNPQRVNELIKTLNLDQCPQEQFWVICCDTKLKPTCVAMVGQGTNNSSEVDIKAIGRYALLSNSNALILVHNHPSGNNEPSPEDIETTRHII